MLAGHGGTASAALMHEEPFVRNEGRRRKGMVLRPGLVIAIEPMRLLGGHDSPPRRRRLDAAHRRRQRAAHVEHTIAVTADGPRILTA